MIFQYLDNGVHVIGGIRQSTIRDLGACIAQCTGTCRSVDFDSADNSCWFHMQQSSCSELIPHSQTNHYKLSPCGTGKLTFFYLN